MSDCECNWPCPKHEVLLKREEYDALVEQLERAHACVKAARTKAHRTGLTSICMLLQPAFYDALKRDDRRTTQDKEKT